MKEFFKEYTGKMLILLSWYFMVIGMFVILG